MEIRTILPSIVRIKLILWLMCCYKLERSANEDAQQSSSAKGIYITNFYAYRSYRLFENLSRILDSSTSYLSWWTMLWTKCCIYSRLFISLTNTPAAMKHYLQCATCPYSLLVSFYCAEFNIAIFTQSKILFKCAWSFAWRSRFCVSALALFLKKIDQ